MQDLGPYQLQGKLGSGGMGEVYRALDTRMGRQVAVKILPESLAGDEERRRRFEQEARIAASLNHPNVMAIYDVGLDGHPPYIVAELVPGESMRALLGKGPLAVRRAVDLAAQIAAGLAAAHSAGIVHRDLKPENVIITPDGTAKILDFGVARMKAGPATGNETMTMAQTLAGSVVGTAAYMSPEQARAEEVDCRSDQFSLGLVLYEMLGGKQAFERPSAIQTMSAIVEDDPPPLERAIPAQLRWIMERCLAKGREGRYESTRDMARDLAYLRDHFGEATGTATGIQAAAAKPARRVPLGVVVVVSLAAALAAWFAGAVLRGRAIDLSHYKFTPFATALTEQSYPAWSPDGKSIAFLGADSVGHTQLYVQAVDGPTAVQVTPPESQLNGGAPPFWSPDSRTIYFRCYAPGVGGGICRAPVGGGAPVLVHENVQAAAISPDGKTLAWFPSSNHEGNVSVWYSTPPDAAPRRYDPMPFEASQFYNNPSLAFSPDGRQILLFVALDTRGETGWLLPWPPGKGGRAFRDGMPFGYTPQFAWMPDSRHLVFADTTAGRQSSLYIGDAMSGQHWGILLQDRPVSQPTLSPDGTRVAYMSSLSHSDIVAVPLGDGPVQTLLGSTRDEVRVDASRVAQQVVYSTNRRGVWEIWIKSLAEGWERPLVTPNDVMIDGEPAATLFNAVFSPDGRRVAFSAKGRTGIHIYTTFVSGGSPVRATTSQDLELCATWSPDGSWLAYSALHGPQTYLMKVRPGSGEQPVTVSKTYGSAAPAWSPTGEWIADREPEKGHLVLVSPDGKERKELPSRDDGPVAWSPDGKTLYQVRRSGPALWAVEIATLHERKLRDLPDLGPYSNGNPGLSAALTSDGKEIVYAVNRPRSEIWILDGIEAPRPWYRQL